MSAIAKGTTIHLLSESAGTDPKIFAAAPFDIAADRERHYGFGGGIHHCLGHFVARSDLTIAFGALSQRITNPRADGESEWLPDSGNTGPVRLPVASTGLTRIPSPHARLHGDQGEA